MSDIQIKPPDRDLSENETVHTSVQNPITEIPITDKPLNFYKNQVIVHCSRDLIIAKVRVQKIFEKIRLTISIPFANFETHLISTIKHKILFKVQTRIQKSYHVLIVNE